jgi:AhpD family alkylhydroperoxidase
VLRMISDLEYHIRVLILYRFAMESQMSRSLVAGVTGPGAEASAPHAFHSRLTYEAFTKTAPAAHAALTALGKAVDESGLEKELTELVKLRASQLNGCAFCIQFHLNAARRLGLASEKLDLVAAWRDAGVFTPREMAALAWTEALTEMGPEGMSDQAYAALLRQFNASEAVFLTVAIGTINQWNRIAVALRFPPPVARASGAK